MQATTLGSGSILLPCVMDAGSPVRTTNLQKRDAP
jgi:hypothetical protein